MNGFDDSMAEIITTRAREKLEAGLISTEEYEVIIKQHSEYVKETRGSGSGDGGAAGEGGDAALVSKLVHLAGSIYETAEAVAASGRATLLGGSHGPTPVRGVAVLTNFRILFVADAAVAAVAAAPGAGLLLSRARVLPEAASLPLHSLQTATWSKAAPPSAAAPGGGGGVVLSLGTKWGRTARLHFADADDGAAQAEALGGGGAGVGGCRVGVWAGAPGNRRGGGECFVKQWPEKRARFWVRSFYFLFIF